MIILNTFSLTNTDFVKLRNIIRYHAITSDFGNIFLPDEIEFLTPEELKLLLIIDACDSGGTVNQEGEKIPHRLTLDTLNGIFDIFSILLSKDYSNFISKRLSHFFLPKALSIFGITNQEYSENIFPLLFNNVQKQVANDPNFSYFLTNQLKVNVSPIFQYLPAQLNRVYRRITCGLVMAALSN